MASSLAAGLLLQHLTTCIACLVIAFLRSWSLALVILSAVPALTLIHGFSQAFAGRQLVVERSELAEAGSLVDRAISAIATVKAFNAAAFERESLATVLGRLKVTVMKVNTIWSVASGLAQFVAMAMFVQGFWFGAKLVKEGKLSAGDVMTVFWACLIATSCLQMCIPQLIVFSKGKFSAAALLNLVEVQTVQPITPAKTRKITSFRKISPHKCHGELAMQNVTFTYPSRPTLPVLMNVTLFLPAHEMTFIVGRSGSGKSTIAQLLLRMYDPQSGLIQLDNQDVTYLDDDWMHKHIACVSQDCILFDMTVRENVAMGVSGSGSGRQPEDVTSEEIIDACRAALMHDFIRELPEGYDTPLGNGGANLSGGQMQRLAIARAKLRDPTVLVLGSSSVCLDPVGTD
jgi:ATP-binding cassette subfamily B (MDR/TAP) protein 1